MRRIIHVSMAMAVLSGCANNEQSGTRIGGIGGSGLGAALGSVISHAGPVGAIGALAGGLAGNFAGGAIGRSLDARDRKLAAQSMQAVLTQPITYTQAEPALQPSTSGDLGAPPPSSPSPDTNTGASASNTQGRPRPPTAPPSPPRPDRPASISLTNQTAPTSQWVSDHSGARGSSTVISAQPPTSTSGECRTIRNKAYIDSREVTETKRMCLAGDNTWKEATNISPQ